MRLIPPFSIQGRSGSTLGASAILLDNHGARDAVLTLASMARGTLRWSQSTTTTVPDIGQTVDLFDGSGTRIFSGTVEREFVWESGAKAMWNITVSDAWKQMEETALAANNTDEAGGVSSRPLVVFPTGDLRASILSLITQLNALGVGFLPGTVSTCFSVPRMTFSKSTGTEAFADMLRWIPDAMVRVDYSVAGLPTLNVIRRADAQTITLALGHAADDTLSVRLRDLPELRPLAVQVFSASRDSQGRIIYGLQTAGDPAAESRRTQRLVASGPENNAILTSRTITNSWVRTFTDPMNVIRTTDPQVADYIATWEDRFTAASTGPAGATTAFSSQGGSLGTSYASNPIVFPSGFYAATFGWDGKQDPPDYMIEALGMKKGLIAGDLSGNHIQSGSPTAAQYKQREDLNRIVGGGAYWITGGYYYAATRFSSSVWLIPTTATLYPPVVTTDTSQANPVPGGGDSSQATLSASASSDPSAYIGSILEWGAGFINSALVTDYDPVTKIVTLNASFVTTSKLDGGTYRFPSSPTEIISPADYDFLFPPSNLAESLFYAQNFLPWQGSSLLGRSAPAIPIPGDTLSVTGGDPSWASARALTQATEIDLRIRTASLTIGTPPLTSPTTLLDSFRSAARDNLAS